MGTSLYEKYTAERGGGKSGNLYAEYLAEHEAHDPGGDMASRMHAEYASGNLGRRMARENENDAEAAAVPEPTGKLRAFGHSLAATGANLAAGIPGMEAAQAGARSLLRRQPYGEALGDIRGQTEKIPGALRTAERIAGALPLAGKLPGSPATSGALLGAADQAFDADPDRGVGERALRTAGGAAVGAVAGKALDLGTTALRGVKAPSLGKSLLARRSAMRDADKAAYGAAASEGAAAATQPMTRALRDAFDSPTVKPFVDMVRTSRKFGSADDATVAREAYKLMSKQQGGLAKRLNEQGFDAATQFQHDELGLAKDELLNAADQLMPSLRGAIRQHAANAGEIDAVKRGARTLRSESTPSGPAPGKAEQYSREGLREWANNPRTTAGDRKAAASGILSDVGRKPSVSFKPLLGTPLVPVPTRALRTAPELLRAIDPKDIGTVMSKLGLTALAAKHR